MRTLPAHYGFAPKKEEANWKDNSFRENLMQEYLWTDLDKELKGLTHEQKSARKSYIPSKVYTRNVQDERVSTRLHFVTNYFW